MNELEPSGDDALDAVVRGDPYHSDRTELRIAGVIVSTKPGVRGYPAAPPGLEEIVPSVQEHAAGLPPGARVLDASGSAGGAAAAAVGARSEDVDAARSNDLDVRVLEPSAAALTCARETHATTRRARVEAGWIGSQAARGPRPDLVVLLPPADRGSARVHAELAAAASVVQPDGAVLLALHKDRGGKRYLRDAGRWFDRAETVGRSRGWRVALARAPRADAGTEPWLAFDAAGMRMASAPGVFAAGKLDPGTGVLLQVLADPVDAPALAGRRVLDLGCGYGVLALRAAAAGADVTAVDEDVAAVDSTARNAAEQGAAVTAVHSDLDRALGESGRFDTILCNPPFHVGKQVRLDLSQAFVRAAHRQLRGGGELWLVANRALPYERYLDGWAEVRTVREDGGFKVLRAVR